MANECDHKWVYQSIVYGHSDRPRPGSGAYDRVYYDRYFCEKCLEIEDHNPRMHGNTYEHAIDGTFPK